MATYISGVPRPTGPLTFAVKGRIGGLGPVVVEWDGWHTATALALYHLSDCGHSAVLICSARRRSFFRLPPGWQLQEPGLCRPIYRCTAAIWLGPAEVAPLGSEAIWPCFARGRKSSVYQDKGPELDPEYPDYSGVRPGQLDNLLFRS